MNRKVTIREIAKELEISVSTVSRVINKVKGRYSNETERKVLKTVEMMGYRPNMFARGLKNKRTYTIGFVVPEMAANYSEIFLGLQSAAIMNGYAVILSNSNYNYKLENININVLLERRIDGAIITTGLLNLSNIDKFIEEGIPIVLLEKFLDYPNIPTVVLDIYKYAKMAVQHLIDNGYRSIVFVSAPPDMAAVIERFKAYKDCLSENGINYNDSLVYFDDSLIKWEIKPGYELIEKILSQKNNIDAFFINSDVIAVAALKAIKKFGYKIPDDIGIMGFDDIRMAEYSDPPLSTVYLPKFSMGAKAVELLVGLIEDKHMESADLSPEMHLSIRGTTIRHGLSY
ncbi:MAG: LacI family transcriptional regulator [Actinobacteria bacterium]|nr:LacI family transcriptional regulator [Actinomycetota bacterium]